MGDVKDFEKDVAFLSDVLEPDKTVEDTQYYKTGKLSARKFYKTKGITADTLKSVADANNSLINGSIKFATNKLKEEKANIKRVFATVYTDLGKIQARVSNRFKKVKNPKTGEESTKLASITVVNIVKSSIDKALVKECEEQIIARTKL